MTDAEIACMDKLTDAINAFFALPPCHPSERAEFVHYAHGMQTLLMARDAMRNHPNYFRSLAGWDVQPS